MTNGRATCTAAPWLSIVGIGEDGVDGLSPVAQRLIAAAELVVGGKRHLGLADGLIRGRSARLAQPDRRGDAGNREASRPAGRRAGERRSVPLWRRRPAAALDSCRRDALPAAILVPSAWRRRGSAGRCRTWRWSACMAARWKASCAICSPARASSLCRGMARRPPSSRSCWSSAAWAARRSPCWKPWAGLANACAAPRRRTSISARSRRSTPSPLKSTRRRMPPCSGSHPASTMLCSSMTASSPSARSAPSRCRRWRRARASFCGTSAWGRARSPSNGCCAIPR